MSKFQVGDRVICLDSEGTERRLEVGRTYSVSFVDTAEGSSFIEVDVDSGFWSESRFELSPETFPISLDRLQEPTWKMNEGVGMCCTVASVIVREDGSVSLYVLGAEKKLPKVKTHGQLNTLVYLLGEDNDQEPIQTDR